MTKPERIDTADVVLHKPSGEMWIVAYADYENDRIAWCGWPDGTALLSDCELIESADDAQRRLRLRDMAKSTGHRAEYARKRLAAAAIIEGQDAYRATAED